MMIDPDKIKENRKFRRFILKKMDAKKRSQFIAKEKFHEELTEMRKEMGEQWKKVVQQNTPEWQRDIALSFPAKWYTDLINRFALVFVILKMKWVGWLITKVLIDTVQGLSKLTYSFGIKTVLNTLPEGMEMIMYKRSKVIYQNKWLVTSVDNLKTAMEKAAEKEKQQKEQSNDGKR